jgi:hypothetical protein
MISCLNDPTIYIYLVTLLIAIYGSCLFGWWWISKGKASSVFAYVTFIFIGEIVESSMSLMARVLWVTRGLEYHRMLMESVFWPGRKLVTMVALAFIVAHMSWRAFRGLPINQQRREDD